MRRESHVRFCESARVKLPRATHPPTSASWLNMVERFFRDLTDQRIRRGVFRSADDLIVAIDEYIATHNQNPKAFIWTKKASDILEKVKRGREALINAHPSAALH